MRLANIARLRVYILVSMLVLGSSVCFGQTQAGSNTSRFRLEITPGPDYESSTTILLFIKIPIYPQVACWIESTDGTFVDTLYVTTKGARGKYVAAPSAGRPEALPVWEHRHSADRVAIDGVSSATPASASVHDASPRASLPDGRYNVFLEVNRSYDYNARYTTANSGVNGQPSLVYKAEIDVGKGPVDAAFVPVGTGSPDGSDGGIRGNLDGITTALTLLSKATIRVQSVLGSSS
jgi:hypothetical protein